ncbi:MAG: hypothetical protein MI810_13470 [Flavobacteriales bacterium]|jgi:hypothetical protein|nr:hypothetical protein [Flavobacteriales bacterium]
MEQLLEALAGLHKGINYPDPIIWHLEPYCYYAQFEKVRNNYKIKISESEEFKGPARFVCEFEGDYQQMILPFYRAMKRFYSYNYQPPAWNEPDQKRIVKLKELVQSKKTNKSDS